MLFIKMTSRCIFIDVSVSSIYVEREREMSCFSDSDAGSLVAPLVLSNMFPGIPTTIKTMGGKI